MRTKYDKGSKDKIKAIKSHFQLSSKEIVDETNEYSELYSIAMSYMGSEGLLKSWHSIEVCALDSETVKYVGVTSFSKMFDAKGVLKYYWRWA